MAHPNRSDNLPPLLLQSHISASDPEAQGLSEAEMIHKDALDAAQAEHERVRETALLAFELHQLREEQKIIREREDKLKEYEREQRERDRILREQENRLRELEKEERERRIRESELAERGAKLREMRANPTPQSQKSTDPSRLESSQNAQTFPPQSSIDSQTLPAKETLPISRTPSNSMVTRESIASQPQSPQARTMPQQAARVSQPTELQSQPSQPITAQRQPTAGPLPASKHPADRIVAQYTLPGTQQYLEIHGRLKKLRKFMEDQAKQNPELKKRMGEMRREIRKSVGQLTEGRGANRQPMTSIVNTLKEALHQIPSPAVDPAIVMLSGPRPLQGATNNGETLPVLFLYLLNSFAKNVVSQFINEAGVSPKAADPIGVVAITVFAQGDLCWRGVSLIDILMCKMRVSCPVLFGIRGSEKTEEGRARLGWKRSESGDWVIEQIHNTRMTGLGAGYAALSLRDFTKTPLKNPYPPTMYWQTMASIVNTPAEATSGTQYTVLKALIENYEQRFMAFYGHAARAALQVALVDFPSRAPEKTVAVSSLMVLGDKLKRDSGLRLKPSAAERNNRFQSG